MMRINGPRQFDNSWRKISKMTRAWSTWDTISNYEKISSSLHTRIGEAFQKWNELKHVLKDRRLRQPEPPGHYRRVGKYDDDDDDERNPLKKRFTSWGLYNTRAHMLTSDLLVIRRHVCVYGSALTRMFAGLVGPEWLTFESTRLGKYCLAAACCWHMATTIGPDCNCGGSTLWTQDTRH